jgi:hypothetical protein
MLDGGPAGWRALGAKRENKKTQLKTSSTNTDRVNEKLFSMEHGQEKSAPLHGFVYISG